MRGSEFQEIWRAIKALRERVERIEEYIQKQEDWDSDTDIDGMEKSDFNGSDEGD